MAGASKWTRFFWVLGSKKPAWPPPLRCHGRRVRDANKPCAEAYRTGPTLDDRCALAVPTRGSDGEARLLPRGGALPLLHTRMRRRSTTLEMVLLMQEARSLSPLRIGAGARHRARLCWPRAARSAPVLAHALWAA
eukprot:1600254-Prymnesium_polylepis.1